MLLNLVGWLLSLVWVGLCVWYLQISVGLGQVRFLLPNEFGQFVTGALLPVALLWLLIGQRQLASRVAKLEIDAANERQSQLWRNRDEPQLEAPSRASAGADELGEDERMPRLRMPDDAERD